MELRHVGLEKQISFTNTDGVFCLHQHRSLSECSDTGADEGGATL